MTTVALVLAVGLSLVLFVSLADTVTMLFAHGAVRAAVEEGVRAGGRSDAPVADCETRARAVLDGLLGPGLRSGVTVHCELVAGPPAVEARADVTLVPWFPGLPAWSFALRAASGLEALP